MTDVVAVAHVGPHDHRHHRPSGSGVDELDPERLRRHVAAVQLGHDGRGVDGCVDNGIDSYAELVGSADGAELVGSADGAGGGFGPHVPSLTSRPPRALIRR